MDPTLVLVIVIGATTSERPRGSIVSGAVAEGLGTNAHVLVEERIVPPSDPDATATSSRLGSSAVAEIAWSDAAHSRAHLHVYLASDHAWYDRDVSFGAADAPEDRERAVGLLVGAMVRARQADAVAAPAPAPAEAPPPHAAPPPQPLATERPARSRATTPGRLGADLGAVATMGIGGDAPALGPSVRGRVTLTDSLSIAAGAAIGFGSVDDAGATMTTARIVAGGRWRVVAVGPRHDVAFDLGVESLVVHHAVHRTSPDISRDRWLFGGHLDIGIGWRPIWRFEPFATVGIDAVPGMTPITVAGLRVAQIPPFRATVEAGARIHF